MSNSGKKYRNIGHHSLPSGLNKAKAFPEDEYLHEIQTHCDQRYFYFCAKCFHSFKVHETPHNLKLALCIVSGDVEYAHCGPSCAAGKSGFCNHILALMMKICKYSSYDCKDVRDLKDKEDENPSKVCISALQNWHRSRMDDVSLQPVMQVVVSNPVNRAEKEGHGGKKTGVTCLLTEARRGRSNQKEKLKDLVKSLEEHSPKLGIIQVVDTTSVDALPAIRCIIHYVFIYGLYYLVNHQQDVHA